MSNTRFYLLLLLVFGLATCRSPEPSTKIIGNYIIRKTLDGTYVNQVGFENCHGIIIPNSTDFVAHPNRGLYFLNESKRLSYIDIYRQQKRCVENKIFLEVLENNLIRFELDALGSPKIVGIENLAGDFKRKLSEDVSRIYSQKVLNNSDYPVKYELDGNGQFTEQTEAKYFWTDPIPPASLNLNSEFYVATTFGLRAYKFGPSGNVISQYGDFDTSFNSIAVLEDKVYLAEPGKKIIHILEKTNFSLQKVISGFSVTTLKPYRNGLLVVAYDNFKNWKYGKLYFFDTQKFIFVQLSDADIADSRGIAVTKDRIYVSDGFNNRIAVFDQGTFSYMYWYGFRYPNGLAISENENILVADEHAGVVREVNFGHEGVNYGFGTFASPSSVAPVKDELANRWLIGDADNNRIVLFNSHTGSIENSILNVRSAFSIWIDQL